MQYGQLHLLLHQYVQNNGFEPVYILHYYANSPFYLTIYKKFIQIRRIFQFSVEFINITYKISSNYPLHVEYIESEEMDNKKKDRFTINLTDETVKGLELDSISVMTSEDSLKALESIDRAIKKTSSERSKYGAYQNRLEHTIKNLDNTSENLQGAESRIADADMAIEMSKLVKLNILQQTGTLMLSQANHLPQAILQLLK